MFTTLYFQSTCKTKDKMQKKLKQYMWCTFSVNSSEQLFTHKLSKFEYLFWLIQMN